LDHKRHQKIIREEICHTITTIIQATCDMTLSTRPTLSNIPTDILCSCLDFLDDDDFLEVASRVEDACPFSSHVMEAIGQRCKSMWDLDQQRTQSQWKPQTVLLKCSSRDDNDPEVYGISRQAARAFSQDRRKARYLADLSRQLFDYNRTPVPFFCPIPIKRLECQRTKTELSPWTWPTIQDRCDRAKTPGFAFLNVLFRDGNCVYQLWEGYRPIEDLSKSNFKVSFDVSVLGGEHSGTFKPLKLYYEKLMGQKRQDGTPPHPQELATLMRKLQITVLFEGQLVVTTGGCQSVCSTPKGQCHDRKYYHDKQSQSEFSNVSSTIEFCMVESKEADYLLDLQVSRS
jgi:hypothetical protein